MQDLSYILWSDYYKDDFLPEYSEIKSDIEGDSSEILSSEEANRKLINLYYSACKLLDLYISYNGVFKNNQKDIIKSSFRYGVIGFGDEWIELYNLVNSLKDHEDNPKAAKYIIQNFFLFNEITDNFNKFLEEDE